LFLDFCNLMYRCGCRSLWAGADRSCNIYTVGVHHCPWCAIGLTGSFFVWATIIAAQVFLALRPGGASALARFVSSVCAFPVVGGFLATCIGLWLGYWD
jgi:hypothetical protein